MEHDARLGDRGLDADRVPPGRGRGPLTGSDPAPDPGPEFSPAFTAQDAAAVHAQLGRPARDVAQVAHRCPCGRPDVVATRPRLADGTPFPTLYYLTCPTAAGAIGTLEASGLMREMTARLAEDPELAAAYAGAHADYLRRRAELDDVPEITGISAGGMPTRVKCLHVLAGHALAAGPGVNPFGDEVLAALGPWWRSGSCVTLASEHA